VARHCRTLWLTLFASLACAAPAAAAPPQVAATTLPASRVGTSAATLNGTVAGVQHAGTFHFEYGPAGGGFGASTPDVAAPAGSAAVPVSASVEGLVPGTAYQFRLVVTSSRGDATGATLELTTAAAPGAPPDSSGGGGGGGSPPTAIVPSALPGGEQQVLGDRQSAKPGAMIIDAGQKRVRLARSRRFRVPGLTFACPAGCRVFASVGRLAHGALTIAAGRTGSVQLVASSHLAALLVRRGRLPLTAVATLRPAVGNPLTVRKKFVLTR
jgi:hypothetical protein